MIEMIINSNCLRLLFKISTNTRIIRKLCYLGSLRNYSHFVTTKQQNYSTNNIVNEISSVHYKVSNQNEFENLIRFLNLDNTNKIDIEIVLNLLHTFKEFQVGVDMYNDLVVDKRYSLNEIRFCTIFKWLNEIKRFDLVTRIYNKIDKSLLNDSTSFAEVIFSRNKKLQYKKIFTTIDDMINNKIHLDVSICNLILASLSNCEQWIDCLIFIKFLLQSNVYNKNIISTAIRVCGEVNNFELLARLMLFYTKDGSIPSAIMTNTLIVSLGEMKKFTLCYDIYKLIRNTKSYNYIDLIKSDLNIHLDEYNLTEIIEIIDNMVDKNNHSTKHFDKIEKYFTIRENYIFNQIENRIIIMHNNNDIDIIMNNNKDIDLIRSMLISCRRCNKYHEAIEIYNHMKLMKFNKNDLKTFYKITYILLDLCYEYRQYYNMIEIFNFMKSFLRYDYLAYCRIIHLIGDINDYSTELDKIYQLFPSNGLSIKPISKVTKNLVEINKNSVVKKDVVIPSRTRSIKLPYNPMIYQICLNILHEGINYNKENIKDINCIDLVYYSPFAAIIMIEYVLSLIHLKILNEKMKKYKHDVTIIVRKVNNSTNDKETALCNIVKHHLQYNIFPTNILSWTFHSNGSIIITAKSITRWSERKQYHDNFKVT